MTFRIPWTDQDDAKLLKEFDDHGNKWSLIGKILGRSGDDVKNRYKKLRKDPKNKGPLRSKHKS
jgi:hypothetical protein